MCPGTGLRGRLGGHYQPGSGTTGTQRELEMDVS